MEIALKRMVEAAGVVQSALPHSTQLIDSPFRSMREKRSLRMVEVRKRYVDSQPKNVRLTNRVLQKSWSQSLGPEIGAAVL
jgi:hypothetical protein